MKMLICCTALSIPYGLGCCKPSQFNGFGHSDLLPENSRTFVGIFAALEPVKGRTDFYGAGAADIASVLGGQDVI